MPEIKAILFDLGGVLIDFSGLSEVRKLMPVDPGPDEIRSRWISSKAITSFERGDLSPAEFAPAFVDEWGLEMEPNEFLEAFRSWLRGPIPGTQALLADLRPHFTLACLSNTNEVHWQIMLGDCALQSQLNMHYASHLIGGLKPQPDVFDFVCRDLGCAPHEVMFFDDGTENVEGARQFGLSAHKVHSPQQIRAKLKEIGLHTPA